MRVIAGTARGTRLVSPKGYDVRPTLDRVREALFNILYPRIEGARFLDLYAGTGANAIEALSRGAEHATLVENDPRSIRAIEQNLKATRLAGHAELRRLDLPDSLRVLWTEQRRYDIVFADPPFAETQYDRLLAALDAAKILAVEPVVVVEHSAKIELTADVGGLSRFRVNKYGDVSLSFFT